MAYDERMGGSLVTNEQLAVLLDSIADDFETRLRAADKELGESIERANEWWIGDKHVGPLAMIGVALGTEENDPKKQEGFEQRPTGEAVPLFSLYDAVENLRTRAESLRKE
jgi:hypothetical protein